MRRKDIINEIKLCAIGFAVGAAVFASMLFFGMKAKACEIRDGVHTPIRAELVTMDRAEREDMRNAQDVVQDEQEAGHEVNGGNLDLLAALVWAEAGDQEFAWAREKTTNAEQKAKEATMKVKIKSTLLIETLLDNVTEDDRILFGDAEWKVLKIEDDKALIWKCTNIEDHVFNEDGRNVYEGSDIQKYLQGEFRNTVPEDLLGLVTGEGFFLLTVEQISELMPREIDRIATSENGETWFWWTASPTGGNGNGVRYVTPSGAVSYYFAFNAYGTAPACWIHL